MPAVRARNILCIIPIFSVDILLYFSWAFVLHWELYLSLSFACQALYSALPSRPSRLLYQYMLVLMLHVLLTLLRSTVWYLAMPFHAITQLAFWIIKSSLHRNSVYQLTIAIFRLLIHSFTTISKFPLLVAVEVYPHAQQEIRWALLYWYLTCS
jgi:hypothetical protein